ncbi:hydrogenase iron-sulfur subunit [Desulfotalea psychrophila]|uniref:Probable fusion protein of heterodisulfide reductase, subunit A (HdrA) and hydrogenase, delta subunit (HydD) n=1 Tax=Desulfotalea psychrophila (strain LSv54 / DSM 12343) TaxID=177439 RepID=Q6AP88_DESPS|nr:hydrogenase iron-sulfur subunit [Desulfotalea psychrophila]CAG35836.1 probable fusion protein of heterodisulfide reductase, subunit A (HdrA) and hydrogenase, delta subunit (HydD) [Desulfotalea psychrophila LSv54]
MDKSYCAYLCSGCGIGDALDMEALAGVVSGEMSMECKTHECLCGAAGRALIEADIAAGTNTVVVGACSPRVMTGEFNFGKDKITVRANLREQVVWSEAKPAEGEEPHAEAVAFLQETAEDYMRMACTRAQKTELADPFHLEIITKTVMVMGGGIAGLTAAKEAAAAGYEVLLVEKEAQLGGKALGWRKSFPSKAPWTDLEENPADALVAAVTADDKITVKLATEVARIGGAPGAFRVSFKDVGTQTEWDAPAKVAVDEQDAIDKGEMENPNEGLQVYTAVDENATLVGSVVLATGWTPADVSQYEHLGYGKLTNVVTNAEFEKIAKEGKVPANVAFVQSPGGKDSDDDFPYCNSVTSMVALKQAQYVCQDNVDGKAYILYQHMRTPGQMELFYKNAQLNDGIFMTKASVVGVDEEGAGLRVNIEETLLGEDVSIDVDMVVLAAGMEPVTLHDSSINLAYRQGPAFSDLDLFDGYADSHFICFPYETRRTGVYTCGGVRKAETMEETIDDATGAALKAIQCIESSDRGVSVHPRSGDATYPEFFMQRCTQCKRCTEECPFGALDDDEKGTPLPNPTRCRRCGICMGACPERIIGFKDYNIDMIGSMIKSIEVPEDDDDRLRIMVFVCENDAYPALDMSGMRRHGISHMVRFIPVRCLGSVNMAWVRDALSAGMDGIMLLGCAYGDDYQCHFVKGSEIAQKRMENIGDTLSSLGLESERCVSEQIAITDFDKVPKLINDFVEEIVEMGPNPFKGF